MGRRCNNERSSCEPPDKKPLLALPECDIKEGTLLVDILGKEWKLGKAIGTGGFGEIYLATDDLCCDVNSEAPYVAKVENHSSGPLFVEIHCYLHIAKLDSIVRWKEKMQMQHLAVPHYVASGSHIIGDNKYRFLIIPRYNKDLESIFEVKRKFNLKTVLTIGLQIIDALEYIHSNGYVHSDIKASNILFNEYINKKSFSLVTSPTLYRYRGCRPVRSCKVRKIHRVLRTNFNLQSMDNGTEYKVKNIDEIYLLDYGLASRYVTSTGEHKAFDVDSRKAHAGTILFCSRDAHVGVQSRRSDLECLGYNLIYWLTSDLPWSKYLSDPEMVHKKKTKCNQNVRAFLEYTFNSEFPRFLYDYFMYLHNLEFEAKPDYKYIKTLFSKALHEYGYKNNLLLDFDSLEGWGRKQKKTKCNSENVKIKRAVQSLTRTPLKSNLSMRPNLRKEKNLKADKDWAQALMDPEEIIKEAKIRRRKMTDTSDSNQSSGIQNLDLYALNPTAAMIEVFNRSMERINSGHTPRYREHSFVDYIEGYTPAMLEVYNRIKEREFQEYQRVSSRSKPKKKQTSKGNKRVIQQTKKEKPVALRRTYSLRG